MHRRVVLPLAFVLSACFIYRTVQVESVERPATPADSVVVTTPLKAHLIDGSTVVFRHLFDFYAHAPDSGLVKKIDLWHNADRAVRKRVCPRRASSRAVAAPIPVDAPVTQILTAKERAGRRAASERGRLPRSRRGRSPTS